MNQCGRCGAALRPSSEAYVCAHECTFCERCSTSMKAICPNCGGELVRRSRPPLNGKESF